MTQKMFMPLRQILPILIGSLLGVSFGSMLGWPSITFPLLVDTEITPILITWDQSAMIAGFLMEGNIVGTAFSSTTLLGSKTGIVASCVCQIAGWIAMYFAQNILEIGISRALVGFGNGFGLGQLRIYAEETCDSSVSQLCMQYLPLSVNVGVIFVYIVGTYTSFYHLSLFCAIIPIVNIVLFTIIPKKLINRTKKLPEDNEPKSGNKRKLIINSSNLTEMGFIAAFRNRKIRYHFFLLWFLIFIAQYTGGAANIVYSRAIHIAAFNPYPNLSSIIYSLAFLISNILALKYTNKFHRKPILLTSCIICSLLLCSVCFYFYYLIDLLEVSLLFSWSPLLLLCLFNFFHTTGINTIPILFITDKFPQNARITASKFYVIFFSLSAVISTKIFQVIFTYCGMHMAYVFLSSVGFGSAFIVHCFVKEPAHCPETPELIGFNNKTFVSEDISIIEVKCEEKGLPVVPKNQIIASEESICYKL